MITEAMQQKISTIGPVFTSSSHKFEARHPMFCYQVGDAEDGFKKAIAGAGEIVVVGMGGSVLPLRAFVDAAGLQEKILFLDSVDSLSFHRTLKTLKNPHFCIVSKSGETLEIKSILLELIERNYLERISVVTDPQKGSLRKWAIDNKRPICSIPENIGGRFTNFSIFHKCLLENFGVNFSALLQHAHSTCQSLKTDSSTLDHIFKILFRSKVNKLILWAYGDRLKSFAEWTQQVLAESLGKRTQEGRRVGLFPVVLSGPQDQHSVLQLLHDGPQDSALWFMTLRGSDKKHRSKLDSFFKGLETCSLTDVMEILSESTYESFVERVRNPETSQPLMKWVFEEDLKDLVEGVVRVQAFVEYAGDRLGINAFDQPGVERGKEIARSMLANRR